MIQSASALAQECVGEQTTGDVEHNRADGYNEKARL
jgi:hypothetical protein